jgi:anti-sigma regulatory factor (Ser/Thr protein kinase)
MKEKTAIDIAAEEIFVNIASYAYGPEGGDVVIQVEILKDPLAAKIAFLDSGEPYDPLAKPDPNTKLPLMEGKGVFMVKKSMDAMDYVYENGKNVLTLTKNLS